MKPEQQQLAQDLYLNTDKTQQEIADILNVNRRTIYLWVKNGKWEEMKLAAKQAPGLIIQDIYNHIDTINANIHNRGPQDRCPTMQEVEMLRKLVNMTRVIQKKHTGTYIEAFTELVIFISRSDDDLAMRVRGFADQYIRGTFGDKSFYTENNIRVNEIISNLKKEEEAQAAVVEQPITAEAVIVPVPIISGSPAEPTVIVPVPIISESNAEGVPEVQLTAGSLHNTSSPLPTGQVGSEFPQGKERSSGEVNATFCDKNAIFSPNPEEKEKSPVTLSDTVSGTHFPSASQPQKYPIGNFSQNETFQETKTTPKDDPPPKPSP